MLHRLFAICLCLAQLSPAGLLAAENPYERFAGTYTGQVFNGDDLDPVVTTFSFSPTGVPTGSYTVDEETGVYSGTLSNILFEGERAISMEWTDKFGEGLAVMEFSSDYSSFTGEWTLRDGRNALPWSGQKSTAE
jgi:hypothetical protein